MDFSYTYQNQVRDLGNAFKAVLQAAPVLLGLIPMGSAATNTKHEWLEDVLAPGQDTINGAKLSTDVTITVANGSKFGADMIVAIDGSDELLKVTGVAGNDLTVTRGFGGSTAEAIADGAIIRIVATPKLQGTDPGDNKGQEPGVEYNYTQILDRTAKVTRTAEAIKKYGLDSALDYQVSVHLDALMRDLNKSIIYGRRIAPAAGVPSMMGGILQFLNQAGTQKTDAAGAALSATLLNNLLELVVTAGGKPVTLLCNTNQARKIAAFNSTTNNYTVMQDSKVAGNQVIAFQGDLPMAGLVQNIVVDINFPKDAVAMLDLSKTALVPLEGSAFTDKDATLPGGDYFARRVLGEYTFEFKNAKQAHGLIKNLQV